jgi:hypothetical protein
MYLFQYAINHQITPNIIVRYFQVDYVIIIYSLIVRLNVSNRDLDYTVYHHGISKCDS